MTLSDIQQAQTDEALEELIAQELEARLPPRQPIEPYLAALRSLPRGLRAVAAIYDLDVSLALDDLGWHFGNWPHSGLAEETISGLKELGAARMAELFEEAYAAARRHWLAITAPTWMDWYRDSPLHQETSPLSKEAWIIYHELPRGLLTYWTRYARAYPDRLIDT